MIGRVSLALAVCLLSTIQSTSDDTLEQTLRAIIQQELARQRTAPPPAPAPSATQSDVGKQLRELTETINKLGSRLEGVEAAVNLRPSSSANAQASFANAQAQYTDPTADDPYEESICKTGPSYVKIGNSAIVEGDIVIGPADQPGAYRYFAPGLPPGSDRVWPNGTVPYEIHASVTSKGALIEAAISAWRQATTEVSLYFRHKTPQDKHYITFTAGKEESGVCLSPVGMLGKDKQQFIWLTSGCGKSEIMHEIGHAIGLLHEHTRDDRNQYVKVNWNNIDDTKYNAARKAFCRIMYNPYLKGEDLTSEYDFKSIMHYGVMDFARPCTQQQEEKCWTIVPFPEKMPYGMTPLQIGHRDEIGKQDVEAVKRLYGKRGGGGGGGGHGGGKPPHPKIVWCCCCWRYRPVDCWRPQARGHEYWRPHRIWFSRYFDEWYEYE